MMSLVNQIETKWKNLPIWQTRVPIWQTHGLDVPKWQIAFGTDIAVIML